jgi:hypothetical protein
MEVPSFELIKNAIKRHNDTRQNGTQYNHIKYNDTRHEGYTYNAIMLNVAIYLLLCWMSLC